VARVAETKRLLDGRPPAGPQPIQRAAIAIAPNRTGLPGQLKAGMEALSGLSMDDVRVHRNSSEPAKLGALAYAQGSDIHLAAGQEQHLPHEAWHVVQQKQGRVKATRQLKGRVPVNDERSLEREADLMGSQARSGAGTGGRAAELPPGLTAASGTQVVQRVTPEELAALNVRILKRAEHVPAGGANLWKVSDAKATVYLLGTHHGVRFEEIAGQGHLGSFLITLPFTSIKTETSVEEISAAVLTPDLTKNFKMAVAEHLRVRKLEHLRDKKTVKEKAPLLRAELARDTARIAGGGEAIFTRPLDTAYAMIAAIRPEKTAKAEHGVLEPEGSRDIARATNLTSGTADLSGRVPTEEARNEEKRQVKVGDQKAIFLGQAGAIAAGKDPADTEERNRQWRAQFPQKGIELWIVGAAHLPGLILGFEDLGMKATHIDIGPDVGEPEASGGEEQKSPSDVAVGSSGPAHPPGRDDPAASGLRADDLD
jgi:hypothetical protein